MNKIVFIISVCLVVAALPVYVSASSTEGVINTTQKYAWGEKTGWVNFNPSQGNVTVTDSGLTGYAWSENYGWINLAPTYSGVQNDGEGHLSGKAWNDQLGWIDFAGVTVDESGNFSGTAGEEGSVFGRLTFVCDQCAVATDWRPSSIRDDEGDDDDDSDDDTNKKKNAHTNGRTVSDNEIGYSTEKESDTDASITDDATMMDDVLMARERSAKRYDWILWLGCSVLLFVVVWKRWKKQEKRTE